MLAITTFSQPQNLPQRQAAPLKDFPCTNQVCTDMKHLTRKQLQRKFNFHWTNTVLGPVTHWWSSLTGGIQQTQLKPLSSGGKAVLPQDWWKGVALTRNYFPNTKLLAKPLDRALSLFTQIQPLWRDSQRPVAVINLEKSQHDVIMT